MKSVAVAAVKVFMSKKNKRELTTETATQRYNEALAAFNKNQIRQSIRFCCDILHYSRELASAWHLLGLALQRASHLAWALKAVDHALRLEPRAAHYWNTQGAILLSRGDRLGAIDAYQHALSLNPQLLDTFLNLALVFRMEQMWEREQFCYQHILLQNQEHVGALLQYGIGLYHHDRLPAAINCFKLILRKQPNIALARFWLGVCLQRLNLLEEAIPCYQQALRDDPKLIPGYVNLGVAYKQLDQPDKALVCYAKALECDQNLAHVYNNQGSALLKLERFDEAIVSFEKAISINPQQVDAYNGLGFAWQMKNELEKAREFYEAAIGKYAEHIDAHFNLATVLFMQGKYAQAWTEYAWRWQRNEMTLLRTMFRLPRWGGQLPKDKKLLVFAEQGFGDNIQFARYIPLLIVEGAKVYVETYPELIKLFSSIPGIKGLIPRGSGLPPCDFMVPMMSIAENFTENEASIPRTMPYLSPVGDLPAKLSKLPWDSHKKKIGICASGKPSHRNSHNRSCDLNELIRHLQSNDRQLFSLQKPEAKLQAYPDIVDIGRICDDFNDMAHAIQQLDLVITVDTSLAHLAGALNRPVWVLLPFVPEWRWQLERTDSPWYPSMRLFRQTRRGDWISVFHQLKEALANEFPT